MGGVTYFCHVGCEGESHEKTREKGEREGERHRDRDRETASGTVIQKDRRPYRKTDSHTESEKDRQTD